LAKWQFHDTRASRFHWKIGQVYYSGRILISWVPDILVPVAQAGIDGNPVECILWTDAA